MATKPANAAQKKLLSDISEWAINGGMFLLYGEEWDKPFHIHHVMGRSAKHNKTPIGHEFVLPVPIELHDPNLNHQFHVGKCKHAFTDKFGKQTFLYEEMYLDMEKQGYTLPNENIFLAILDTRA